ncbi:MAG: hypothetical protein P4M02_10180, partial [Clostridia bacterium]|nr:hypothetical protein [Clostridia bacterium]
MQGFIIVATVIAVIVAYSIYSTFHGRRKRVDKLRRCFGKIPTQKYDETDMESIACYWQERSHAEKLPFAVDDTTWGDLDMDAVFARVNNTCSSVGEEYLYGALHETQFNGEKLAQREQLIRYLDAHDEERLRLQTSLDRLGKVGFNGLCGFLYH